MKVGDTEGRDIEDKGHRGQTQLPLPPPGAVPVSPSPLSCCTCEPEQCAAPAQAVSELLYPPHQLIHLAQGGSVDAPARGGGHRGAQRDVHMGQGQVQEEGTSTVTAQGTEGECSASRSRRSLGVVALLSLGTQTSDHSTPASAAAPWGKNTPAANPPGTPLLTGRTFS